MDLDKVDAVLDRLDRTGLALIPVVNTVASMAKIVVGMAHKMGLDTKPFEGVVAELDAALVGLDSAVADSRAKFPRSAAAPTTDSTTIGG